MTDKAKQLESALSWAAAHTRRALEATAPTIKSKHLQLSKQYIEEAEALMTKPITKEPNLCSEIPLFKGDY